MSQLIDPANYKDAYNNYWQRDDRVGSASSDLKRFSNLIIRHCGLGNVLDIGCGEGFLVGELLNIGVDAHGVDVSSVVIERANQRYRGRFRSASVLKLPFEDEAFDVTASTDCLEHLAPADIPIALKEIFRVTRRYAVLQVATTQDRDDHWHLTVESRDWWEKRFFEAGFRKHPAYYRINNYESLNRDDWQIIIALEKIANYCEAQEMISRSEDAAHRSQDMLRASGVDSDAHVIRYDWACGYVKPGDRVLDAACGLGYGAHVIRNLTGAAKVIGIDGSEYSIKYANKMYGVGENQADYLFGMLPDILASFPDASFEVVVSFETLGHVEDPQALIDEFNRILVPGGRVIVSVPNDWSDRTGEDPNPYHLHVYDWAKLKRQLNTHFILENAFAQTASRCKSSEKGNEWVARGRSLHEVNVAEDSPVDCEWWLMTAMKSPLTGKAEDYEERVFANLSTADHPSIQYTKYFQNPWLMHAMVNSEYRLRNLQALEALAKEVIDNYPQGSNDYSAGLCVLAYSVLENHNSYRKHIFIGLLNDAQEVLGNDPMALRWNVSLGFVKAKLMESVGDQASAMQSYFECARLDVRQFGVHLSTKTTEAAYRAGVIAYALGDHQASQRAWAFGVSLGKSLLEVQLNDVLINPARPNCFNHGDGVREYTVAWDNVARCANGLNLLSTGKEMSFSALNSCFQTEYQGVVKDLLRTCSFLAESNKELLLTRDTLRERTETLEAVSEELKSRTDELVATRETLRERTVRLEATADELKARTDELVATRETLRERTVRLEACVAKWGSPV